MKPAEEQVIEYMGGTREEVGEEPFDAMVRLLNETKLDAIQEAARVVKGPSHRENCNCQRCECYHTILSLANTLTNGGKGK